MRIVHISHCDGGDGAAIAAYRLHRSMVELGHDSRMFVETSVRRDPTVVTFRPPTDVVSYLRRRARRFRMARAFARHGRPFYSVVDEAFSDGRSRHGADPLAQLPVADIINVHNLVPLVDEVAFLATVPRRVPVVRTLPDMNAFTGGCHYDGGCGKHAESCGRCPQLPHPGDRDLSRQIWERKRAALRHVPGGRLHFVTPSRWLADELRRSTLLGAFPVTVIPYGVDTVLFRPVDRHAARGFLRVPLDAFVVLFVAQPITRRLKGFTMLAEALQPIRHPHLLLLSAGTGVPPSHAPCPHLHLGHVADERFLPLVYAAANVCVVPSMQEAFGQVVLESMACGVPVIGYASGGILDLIRDQDTGILVPVGDVPALTAAVKTLLRDPERLAKMGASSRRVALQEYTRELQAHRHLNLYESILGAAAIGPTSAAEGICKPIDGPSR